jgi:hypothetical protein
LLDKDASWIKLAYALRELEVTPTRSTRSGMRTVCVESGVYGMTLDFLSTQKSTDNDFIESLKGMFQALRMYEVRCSWRDQT